MEEPQYTVCMSFYNQHDRLRPIIEMWEGQEVPPKEIIIVDDGSDVEIDVDALGVEIPIRVVRREHDMNLARNCNEATRRVKTKYMVHVAPDFIYTPNFAAESIRLLEYANDKDFKPIGTFGGVDDITQELPEPTTKYEINGARVYRTPEACLCGWMERTKDTLWFNERYKGWGKFDDDYTDRYLASGGRFYGYNDFGFWHWNHEKSSNPAFYDLSAFNDGVYAQEKMRLHREHKYNLMDEVWIRAFDDWRDRYEWYAENDKEQKEFFDDIARWFPTQAHYDLDQIAQFFVRNPSIENVIEIGGWQGDMARDILGSNWQIKGWMNIEYTDWAAFHPNCYDPRYHVSCPDNFRWWKYKEWCDGECNVDAIVMTHVAEHLKLHDFIDMVKPFMGVPLIYIESPIDTAEVNRLWKGYYGTHVIDAKWPDLIEGMDNLGYDMVYADTTGTCMTFQRRESR
jgi:glycosyltransferase involved in cell wall biosynthesis